jgi:hypothetical protein
MLDAASGANLATSQVNKVILYGWRYAEEIDAKTATGLSIPASPIEAVPGINEEWFRNNRPNEWSVGDDGKYVIGWTLKHEVGETISFYITFSPNGELLGRSLSFSFSKAGWERTGWDSLFKKLGD